MATTRLPRDLQPNAWVCAFGALRHIVPAKHCMHPSAWYARVSWRYCRTSHHDTRCAHMYWYTAADCHAAALNSNNVPPHCDGRHQRGVQAAGQQHAQRRVRHQPLHHSRDQRVVDRAQARGRARHAARLQPRRLVPALALPRAAAVAVALPVVQTGSLIIHHEERQTSRSWRPGS